MDNNRDQPPRQPNRSSDKTPKEAIKELARKHGSYIERVSKEPQLSVIPEEGTRMRDAFSSSNTPTAGAGIDSTPQIPGGRGRG